MSKKKPDPSVKQHPPHIRRVMEALKCRKYNRVSPTLGLLRCLYTKSSRVKFKKEKDTTNKIEGRKKKGVCGTGTDLESCPGFFFFLPTLIEAEDEGCGGANPFKV